MASSRAIAVNPDAIPASPRRSHSAVTLAGIVTVCPCHSSSTGGSARPMQSRRSFGGATPLATEKRTAAEPASSDVTVPSSRCPSMSTCQSSPMSHRSSLWSSASPARVAAKSSLPPSSPRVAGVTMHSLPTTGCSGASRTVLSSPPPALRLAETGISSTEHSSPRTGAPSTSTLAGSSPSGLKVLPDSIARRPRTSGDRRASSRVRVRPSRSM